MENNKKRVAFVVYRQWSFDIYQTISEQVSKYDNYEIPLLITTPNHEFSLPKNTANFTVAVLEGNDQIGIGDLFEKHKIEVVFFYGWSWMVREPILSKYTCLCLHPAPLPKYRGGTPIQHQIVAGEKMSAVSVFKMSEGIDDGDIYKQIPFSLAGTLDEILSRMIDLGIVITRDFLQDLANDSVIFHPQLDLENNPALKRRTQADGEIHLERARTNSYEAIYNLVRGLNDPYPNAYITLTDGFLYLQSVQKRSKLPSESIVLNSGINGAGFNNDKLIVIQVSDGYALIAKSKFVASK